VRPTSSVLRYASREVDPVQAARELGVGWLLEGSFRRGPDRLRVTVQLLAVPAAVPVWGATFHDDVEDPFSAQDAIARRVAEALVPGLSAEEQRRLSAPPTRDPDAFSAYLRGRFHEARRTEADLARAIACFEEATIRDPGYALAHAALAEALTLRGSAGYGTASEKADLARARAAVLCAVAREPALAEGHATLGFVRFRADWDWDGAEHALTHAIALNPACATAWHFLGLLLAARGRFDGALVAIRRAEELDPLSPVVRSAVGRILHFAGRYQEAIAQLLVVCGRDPGFPGAHADLGLSLHQAGRPEDAIGRLERALELSGGRAVIASVLGNVLAAARRTEQALRQLEIVRSAARGTHLPAYVLLGLGRHQEALDLLEPAAAAKAGLLVYLKVEPLLDPVRGDPRFVRLLEAARLAG
jgi:serine/threonine-protein kinase